VGALDPVKILAVLVIALIVLGPEKLPRVARQLGAAWHELTKFRDKVEAEVRQAIPEVDLPRLPTRPSAAVAGFVADLAAPLRAANPLRPGATGVSAPAADAGSNDGAAAQVAQLDGAAGVAPARAPAVLDRLPVALDDPSMN
jgi:sec-independent protein translocase protein TatB